MQLTRDERRKIAEQNYNKFVTALEKQGLMIKKSRGDGNCLFRSFSDQYEGKQDNYNKYRQKTVSLHFLR